MSDVHSSVVRSYNMSRIRSKDTKPEMIVRKYLFSEGFRCRLHAKKLPGKPDIVLPRYKTVILIQGCFWHGHEGCKHYVVPKTRTDWWINKIQKNKIQDALVENKIQDLRWRVIEIWECQLKASVRLATLQNLKETIMADRIG